MKKRHLLFSRKQEKQLEEYQRDLIETHFQEVNAMYRQIRGWRHDYRNHIQTMKAYAADQNWDALVAYLNLLDTDLHTVDLAVKTGNAMTDAILNSKISLAKSKDIPLRAEASIPYELKIPELDLCVIIGNLLDNAIEASLTLPKEKRMIRLYMDMKGPQLYIHAPTSMRAKKCPGSTAALPPQKGTAMVLGWFVWMMQ